jgi:hypothetical protein
MPKVQPTQSRRDRVRACAVSGVDLEINVVPLVDVMLVLLVIFMVTAPMLQRRVDVNLPVARRSGRLPRARVRHRRRSPSGRTARLGTERRSGSTCSPSASAS